MKPYEELDITDNFMFCKVFSNVDVAKDFLQAILKVNIEKISVVAEATTQEDPFHKGVRFDTPPQACSLLPEHVRTLWPREPITRNSRNSTFCSSAPTIFSIRERPFTGSRTAKKVRRKLRWMIFVTRIFIFSISTPI